MNIPHLRSFSLLAFAFMAAGAFWQGLYSPGQQLLPAVALSASTLALLARQTVAAVALGADQRLPAPAVGPAGLAVPVDEATALILLLLAALVATGAPVAGSGSPVAPGTAAHGPVVVSGWLLAWAAGRYYGRQAATFRRLALFLAILGFLMPVAGLLALPYLPPHHSGRLASFLGYPIAVGMLGLLGGLASLPELAAGRTWAGLLLWGNGLALWLSGSRGVWAAALLAVLWLGRQRPRLLRRAWLPVALALVAALWLAPLVGTRTFFWRPDPGWLLGKIALREGSGLERSVLFRDGLAIARDYPLGAGYRAWTALHLQYASYGYYAAEVHSALLDLAISFGWAGAAAFLWQVARFLARLRGAGARDDHQLALLTALAALALHGLVDWDLSYGFFANLLWFGFGLAGACLQPAATPGARDRGGALPTPFIATLAGLTLAAGLLLASADLAAAAGHRALANGAPAAAYRHARLAVALTPWADTGHALLGRALLALDRPAAAAAALARARSLGPREPAYAEWHGRALAAAGSYLEAAKAYRDLVRLWPWRVQVYETALLAQEELALQLQYQGRTAEARAVVELARAVLADLEAQKAREPAWTPRQPMETETPVLRHARRWLGR